MAQLKKLENTTSDHPKLKELLDSVDLDLDNLFNNESQEKTDK